MWTNGTLLCASYHSSPMSFCKKRFRGGFDIYLHHQRYYITLMFKDFIYGYIYFLCVGASPKGYNVMHIEY